MSIQTYNKSVHYDDREVACGQDVPELTDTGVTMDFQITVMTTVGRDKVRSRSTRYTIVGHNPYGNTTFSASMLSDIIDAGARMASNIAELSKGVLTGFYAKLGKFRSDECPIDVAAGDNSKAIVDFTNNGNEEYGLNPCDSSEENPVVPASLRLYIPWLRDDVSRQDIVQSLQGWAVTLNGIQYSLGTNKFTNADKTHITAYPTPIVRNIVVSNYSRRHPTFLSNNDVSMGWNDNVVSEEYNTVEEGIDDRPDDVIEP